MNRLYMLCSFGLLVQTINLLSIFHPAKIMRLSHTLLLICRSFDNYHCFL